MLRPERGFGSPPASLLLIPQTYRPQQMSLRSRVEDKADDKEGHNRRSFMTRIRPLVIPKDAFFH